MLFMWRSVEYFTFHFIEAVSLVFVVHQFNWPGSFRTIPVLTFHLPVAVLGLEISGSTGFWGSKLLSSDLHY